MPETCEPCPLQSAAEPPAVTSSMPVNARPVYSEWVKLMPVSMMYTVTPVPSAPYVYVPLNGRARWSSRSMPHVAPDWVALTDMTWSCSTYATLGSARSAATFASDSSIAMPLSAALYV